MNNLYEILGVSKTAPLQEIKKKYKLLAMKYHPDRNSDGEEKFKEISKAYEILSDEEKKQNYDMFGSLNSNESPINPFSNMFMRKKQTLKKLKVSIEEIYLEKTIVVNFKILNICLDCLGKGTRTKDGIEICKNCGGCGRKLNVNMLRPGFITSMEETCRDCMGLGKRIKRGYECYGCKGGKLIDSKKDFSIPLKNTFKTGKQLILADEGDTDLERHQKSDLVVEIEIDKHPLFDINENNLEMTYNISLIEALCGFDFVVKHPSGETIHINETDIIEPNMKKIIKNMGINRNGDLIVTFNVIFPKNKISETKKNYITKLLENKNIIPKTIPPNAISYNFSNYVVQNPTTNNTKHTRKFPTHQENVGCATQ